MFKNIYNKKYDMNAYADCIPYERSKPTRGVRVVLISGDDTSRHNGLNISFADSGEARNGFNLSIFGSVYLGKINGVSIGGGGTVAETINGVNMGVLYGYCNRVRGINLGIAGAYADDVKGANLGGVIGLIANNLTGISTGIINYVGNTNQFALMLGLVNVIEEYRGGFALQIGVYNKIGNRKMPIINICGIKAGLEAIVTKIRKPKY
jgi:hypothetical protein